MTKMDSQKAMKKGMTGILLAGGQSRRFGKPKAFEMYHGKALYMYALEALLPSVNQLMIVSEPTLTDRFKKELLNRPKSDGLLWDVLLIEDVESYKGKGPLAGIYSAMTAVNREYYAVLPCDAPFITADVFSRMMDKLVPHEITHHEKMDAVIPVIDGYQQPLIAIYHRRCLALIESLLKQNLLSMKDLLKHLHTLYMSEADFGVDAVKQFKNINTMKDMEN